MFYYNRQIVYMDLWKAGERAGNAGFLKLEETDRKLRWEIRIRGLEESDTGFFDLRDETGALVDKILLQKGEGSYVRTFEPGAVTRGGRLFGEICGLRAELSGGRYLKGTWRLTGRTEQGTARPKPDLLEAVRSEPSHKEEIGPESPMAERNTDRSERQRKEAERKAIRETGRQADSEREEEYCPKGRCLRAAAGRSALSTLRPNEFQTSTPSASSHPAPYAARIQRLLQPEDTRPVPPPAGLRPSSPDTDAQTASRGRNRQASDESGGGIARTFYEDKWEQLVHMYPGVHPFGDERMFLSITPGDFVILGREYQKLVHNSFLLHGYYNYRHVILGRYPEEEGESFYLGVPGVYYDREKMAAEMFGFEAFEGKREPAEQGDFGYYMKRVRI